MLTQEADVSPFRYMTIVLRRRWKLVGTIAILGAAAGILIAALVPPRYTAKAQIVIDAQAATVANVIDDAAIDTRVEMLMSAGHLRRVAKSFRETEATVSDVTAPRTIGQRLLEAYARSAGQMGASSAGADKEKEGRADKGEAKPAPTLPNTLAGLTVDDLERSLNVFKERKSRLIAVTYASTDPATAAAVANRAVEVYVDDLRNQRLTARTEKLLRLEEQIPEAKATMETAENTLRSFAIANGFLDDGRSGEEDNRIAEINRQLAIARSQLAERRHQLDSPEAAPKRDATAIPTQKKGAAGSDAGGSGATFVNAQPAALNEEQTQSAMDPTRRSTSQDDAPDQIERDTQVIKARVLDLERLQSTLQNARMQSLEAQLKYHDLKRTAASTLEFYEGLLRKQADLLSQESVQADARVVSSAAIPEKPSSPDMVLFILPATIFALLGGGFLGLLLERTNRNVRSELSLDKDARQAGVVLMPHVAGDDRARPDLIMSRQPFSAFADAMRAVAVTGVDLPGRGDASRICLVTSSGPGEGKTTLAVSLAAYARTLGRRVLLIDMDFRNSDPSRGFEAGEGRGILDVLEGMPATDRIVRDRRLDIDVLPLPRESVDPMAILAHERLPTLLQHLREQYDCVIIDGSHMMGTADFALLTLIVNRVIFAVRWGHTRITAANEALARLLRLMPPDAGTQIGPVLTMVNLERYRRHRFSELS